MTAVFQNKMWLMAGVEGGRVKTGETNYDQMEHKNDIWVSEDGFSWQLVSDAPP